jgi:excisionase family DNA binding protein
MITLELPGLPERLLTMQEVADYLGVSLYWMRDSVRYHRVPHSRIGKHVRFTREHVQQIILAGEQAAVGRYVSSRKKSAAAEKPVKGTRSGARGHL